MTPMFPVAIPQQIFCCNLPIDFRKSYDGLCGEVRQYIGMDPLNGSLFVFYNRRCDRIKMLLWDRDGFWIFQKRLEAGTFQFPLPHDSGSSSVVVNWEQLHLLLYGIDLRSVRHRKRYSLPGERNCQQK